MKTFTKWFVINAIIFTASIGGFQQGVFQTIISHDPTHLVGVFFIIYAIFSLYVGKTAYQIDKQPGESEKHIHSLQPAYFCADNFLYGGLFLTTSGLAMTILKAMPLAQGGDTAEFLKQLLNGIGLTLFSTIVAIGCTILLSIQLFIVSRNLKNEN